MERFIEFIHELDIKTIITILFGFWYFTRQLKKEIKGEIDEIKLTAKDSAIRFDQQINRLDTQILENTKRSDRLYKMFIDLLREKNVEKTIGPK